MQIKYDDEVINVHDPTQFYSGDIEVTHYSFYARVNNNIVFPPANVFPMQGCEPEFIPTTESTNEKEGDEGDEISIEDAEPIEERNEPTEETVKKEEDEDDDDEEVIETTEDPILDVEPILHKSEVKEETDDDTRILPTEPEVTDNLYETHSDASVPALATTTTEVTFSRYLDNWSF